MRHVRQLFDGVKVRHGVVFDDPVELLDMVCEAGAAGVFERYLPNPFDRPGDLMRWFGRSDLKDWPHLRRELTAVWKPGLDRVERLLTRLESIPFKPPRDLRRKNVWRDDGEGDFDLDRFCDGQPAWRGPNRREVIGRQFLTFVVDVAANCNTSADDLYWRAATTIAAARHLEEFGYGVEVLAAANLMDCLYPPKYTIENAETEDDNERNDWEGRQFGIWREKQRVPGGVRQDVTACVWVKRPDDPLDLGLMIAACSPWFFRLGIFGLCGLIPGGFARPTLGHAVQLELDRVDELSGSGGPDRERVALANVWSEKEAAQLLTETLKRFAEPEWVTEQENQKGGT